MSTRTIPCKLRVGRELIATESEVKIEPLSADKELMRRENGRDMASKTD